MALGSKQSYGVSGSPTPQFQGVVESEPVNEGLAGFVMKLGERYAGAKIAEKQQDMFRQGMQRVATGEALSDIKKDDPAFANVFGPTATLRGAQAMAKVKGVDDVTTEIYNQMPALAKMDPSAAGKVMMQSMQKHLTGDNEVDNVLQMKIVEQLPTLMKAQSKANYAYVQSESARQYSGMVNSAANTIQGAALNRANGITNDEDFTAAKQNALLSLRQPQGMDDATYRETVKKLAINQMAQGNHWIDRWMNERVDGHPSFYESVLDTDDQTAVIKARQEAESTTAKQYGFNQYGAAIAQLSGQSAGMSSAQIQTQVLRINEQYMAETGSQSGIITQSDMMSMQKGSYQRAFRLQDKRAEQNYASQLRTAEDAAKQTAQIKTAITLAESGAGKFGISSGVPKPEYDQMVFDSWQVKQSMRTPEEASSFIVKNYTHGNEYVNPQLSSMMQEPFRQLEGGGPIGEEFDRTQQIYTQLISQPDGQAAADAYLGTENAIRMEQYNRFIKSGSLSRIEAAQAVFGKPLVKNPGITTADNKDVLDSALKKLSQQGGGGSWLRGIPDMDDGNKAILMEAAGPDMQLLMDNLNFTPEQAAKRAAPAVLRKLDILGPAVIRKAPGQDSLAQAIGSTQEDAGRAFFETAATEARKQGVNVALGGWFESALGRRTAEAEYEVDPNQRGAMGGQKLRKREGAGSEASTFSGKFSPWQAMTTHGKLQVNRLKDQTIDGETVQIYHTTVVTPSGESASFTFDSRQVRKQFETVRVKGAK
jgi:hypothetical protein